MKAAVGGRSLDTFTRRTLIQLWRRRREDQFKNLHTGVLSTSNQTWSGFNNIIDDHFFFLRNHLCNLLVRDFEDCKIFSFKPQLAQTESMRQVSVSESSLESEFSSRRFAQRCSFPSVKLELKGRQWTRTAFLPDLKMPSMHSVGSDLNWTVPGLFPCLFFGEGRGVDFVRVKQCYTLCSCWLWFLGMQLLVWPSLITGVFFFLTTFLFFSERCIKTNYGIFFLMIMIWDIGLYPWFWWAGCQTFKK